MAISVESCAQALLQAAIMPSKQSRSAARRMHTASCTAQRGAAFARPQEGTISAPRCTEAGGS